MANISQQEIHELDQKTFDVFKLALNNIPDVDANSVIYHYTSPEGLKGITENECLWATDINYLNDSSELRYIHQITKSIVKSKKDVWNARFCDSVLNYCEQMNKRYDMSNRLLFAHKKDVYVISFCLEQDNLSMWKCYTKTSNSMGYNIGFCKDQLVDISNAVNITYGKVIYDEYAHKQILNKALESFEALYAKQNSDFARAQVMQMVRATLDNLGVFLKHPAFCDEKEFRIILRDNVRIDKGGIYEIKYRIKDGVFIPYTEFHFERKVVKSIGISPSDKQKIAEYSVERMLDAKYDLKYGDFYCSKIPYNP